MNRYSHSLIIFVALITAACGDAPIAPRGSHQAMKNADVMTSDAPHFSGWQTPVNVGNTVNTVFTDGDPSISKDGLSLYFVSGAGRGGVGLRDIWVSHRESVDASWGPPQNLGSVVNSQFQEDRPVVSPDGHLLFFASNRPGGFGDFDLYVCRRRNPHDDFGWEAPVNLGSAINSSASEQSSVASFEDEESGEIILHFASNRPGGSGGFDIYSSRQYADGSFAPAQLVPELSTPFNDRDPAVRHDGLELFLASNRPGTFGALDLWSTSRAGTSDAWSAPVNMGPLINTPTLPPDQEQANDMTPSISFDGTTLYFASAFRDGNVSFMFDIWSARRSKLRGLDESVTEAP